MKIIERLLIIRQNIIRFYKSYDYIARPLLKLISIYIILTVIMTTMKYHGVLSNAILVLFISLMGTVLPEKGMILGLIVLIPFYVLELNPILAGILFIFLVILYLIFMRLFPKESLWMIVMIAACCLKIQMLVPFVAALLGGYVCAIPILLGTFLWYIVPNLSKSMLVDGAGQDAMMQMLQGLLNINVQSIIADSEMLSVMIIFLVVFTTIYLIRRLAIDYAHYIAIGMGGVMNVAGFTLATLFFEINISLVSVFLATLLYMCIAVVIEFFSNVLDYERSEILNFEDDENYYYVKVVPKIYLNTTRRKVKRIYTIKGNKTEKSEPIKQNIVEQNTDTSL